MIALPENENEYGVQHGLALTLASGWAGEHVCG